MSSSTNAVIAIEPSLNDPYCTVPLAVMFVAPVIAPLEALNVPSVSVPPCTEPLNVAATPPVNVPSDKVAAPSVIAPAVTRLPAVMLPLTVGALTSPIVIVLLVTAVSISLLVPEIVSFSPPFTVSSVPLSASILKLVVIEVLEAAVIRP